MGQSSPQFTPQQILEAGRRAEQDGRLDYAVQFYRHLVDHMPGALETIAAREALQRIQAQQTQTHEPPTPSGPRPGPRRVNGAPPMPTRSASGSGAPAGFPGAHQGAAMNGSGHGYAAPPEAAPSYAAARGKSARVKLSPGSPDQLRPALVLPLPQRRFRSARVLAGLVGLAGLLAAVAGLASFAVGMLAPQLAVAAGASAVAGIAGLGLFALGLVLILVTQGLKAMFDQAEALKDLAAIERAKAAYRAGVPLADPEADD